MTKLQWAGVIAALGVGVLAQIPWHDPEETSGRNHELAKASSENMVTLAVSGMT